MRFEFLGDAERLVVASRCNCAVIDRFLAPAERERIADQLKAALAEMRAQRCEARVGIGTVS